MQQNQENKSSKNKIARNIAIILGVLALCGAFVYWQISNQQIAIDKSQISAPIINLSPTTQGTLNSVYVNEGDTVNANTVVAEVGTELIKAKTSGLIISVNKDIGTVFNPGQTVVSMIDPSELRVVGQIDENKGLSDIHVGQRASFTVDAFGSKKYYGIVDEVGSTSQESGVVFNISDQRQTQVFDIKVKFDINQYSELKNGMSAKLVIYK